MAIRTARLIARALAISTITAAASYAQSEPTPSPRTRGPMLPAIPQSEMQALHGMTDSNILGHLVSGDSVEVTMAQAALRRTKSDDVREFAKLMVSTHGGSIKAERNLARELGIGTTTMVGELKRSHMSAELDSVDVASDLTIDRHYIMSQVEMHQHMLSELETLATVAKDPKIRDHINTTIPIVRDHLARAHKIAVSKGLESKKRANA